jgi:hypothetical protein
MEEEFEDAKRVIRICISKNRQHNGHKKKYKSQKGQTTIYKRMDLFYSFYVDGASKMAIYTVGPYVLNVLKIYFS